MIGEKPEAGERVLFLIPDYDLFLFLADEMAFRAGIPEECDWIVSPGKDENTVLRKKLPGRFRKIGYPGDIGETFTAIDISGKTFGKEIAPCGIGDYCRQFKSFLSQRFPAEDDCTLR